MTRLSGEFPVLRQMMNNGEPLTRENYILHNWMADVPKEWTYEHEAELPEPFQRPLQE